MIKYKLILSLAIFLLSIVLAIVIWRTSQVFNNLSTMLPEADTISKIKHSTEISPKDIIKLTHKHKSTQNPANQNEITEEIISRIKQDVIVTGTITGTPGQESALFQIKGTPDRSFNINTHLMDGFTITNITQNHVVLKNQMGDESFTMPVQSGNPLNSMEPDIHESRPLKPDEHEPRPMEPVPPEPMEPVLYQGLGSLKPDEHEPRPMEPVPPEPMEPVLYQGLGSLKPDEHEPRPIEQH